MFRPAIFFNKRSINPSVLYIIFFIILSYLIIFFCYIYQIIFHTIYRSDRGLRVGIKHYAMHQKMNEQNTCLYHLPTLKTVK